MALVAAVSALLTSCGSDAGPSEEPGATVVETSTSTTSIVILAPDLTGTVIDDPGPPPSDTPVPPTIATCPPDCP